MAMGLADDFLSTLVAANTAPVLVVPSMNTNMFNNTIVQRNIKTLLDCGYNVMDPDNGLLAYGSIGKGRLPGIPEIYQEIIKMLNSDNK
jgi:phosphopantothenoylcysteine decarboxylase/phosphopantothenate--cysteine ligase